MEKDLDKLLSRTLITYFTILFVVFILKMFGLNYFGLDTNNEVLQKINNLVNNWYLKDIWYCITLYLNTFIIMSITCNDKSKKMIISTLIVLPISYGITIFENILGNQGYLVLIDLLYLFILSLCYIKVAKREKIHKYNVSNYFLLVLIINIFQIISMLTRNVNIKITNDFVISTILSLDYLVLCLMTFELYFIKGGKSLWEKVLGSSSDLLTSLKKLPRKFLQSYQESKPEKTENELAYKIYLTLFWLYNIFTIAFILLIATLNDTFIECIFILSSFWINKGVFGKAFHLSKASTCFIVSSLSYYVLNRLTWNIGISFLVPVILGISLSYITSKLMARNEKIYLYKGIPEEDFNNLITKVTSNKEYIKICKMFYVDRESNIKIAMKVGYSEANIKKIKGKINKKIKELYQ